MEAFFGNYCHVCKQLLCVRVCSKLLIPFLETVSEIFNINIYLVGHHVGQAYYLPYLFHPLPPSLIH